MRTKLIAGALVMGSALAIGAAPIAAEAQTRKRVLVCENPRRAANTGTAVGAVAGHQIAKNNAKKRCRYVYRYR